MNFYKIENDVIYLLDDWTKETVPQFLNQILKIIEEIKKEGITLFLNGNRICELDSAGVALIDEILEKCNQKIDSLINFSDTNQQKIKIFSVHGLLIETPPDRGPFLLIIGDNILDYLRKFFDMILLTSEIFYWSIIALLDKKGHRENSFIQQSILIGFNALPIVGLLSFIIGFIIALQSAVQLKQFGADQFLANLLSITLVREISPLITAIIVAGRSGSAIASEIATMKVTEELDALKMMALNPIRYVVVPKFHAVTVCMSLLVLFSILVGILGGLIVATTVSDLSPNSFLSACVRIVKPKDLIITLIKSIVFSWQIVVIGSHYGFQVKGGAEGVGKATTQSVVAAIFGVIIMDAIFSLIYLIK